MDYSSHVRVLLSVWVGLGLGQLVQSLHRLARSKAAVMTPEGSVRRRAGRLAGGFE